MRILQLCLCQRLPLSRLGSDGAAARTFPERFSRSAWCDFSWGGKTGRIIYIYICNWTRPRPRPPPPRPPVWIQYLQPHGVHTGHAEWKHAERRAEVISWTTRCKHRCLLTELLFCCLYMHVKMGWVVGGGVLSSVETLIWSPAADVLAVVSTIVFGSRHYSYPFCSNTHACTGN